MALTVTVRGHCNPPNLSLISIQRSQPDFSSGGEEAAPASSILPSSAESAPRAPSSDANPLLTQGDSCRHDECGPSNRFRCPGGDERPGASAGAAACFPTAAADHAQLFRSFNSFSLQLYAHAAPFIHEISVEKNEHLHKKTHHLEGWNTCPSRGKCGCCQVFCCGCCRKASV